MSLRPELSSFLRALPLFAALDDEQFRRLADSVQVLALEPQQMLFQRGDPAHHWYVVLDGSVKLALHSRAGDEKVVERLGPGQSFGEALMFMEAPAFPLAAVALETSEVLAVPNSGFIAALKESPETCFRMLADLSRRLHGLVREIEELTLASASLRLVRHVLDLAGPEASGAVTVTLEGSKQMLASRLAIKPETLSRILRSLSDAGVVAVDGRTIHVPSLERLREVA